MCRCERVPIKPMRDPHSRATGVRSVALSDLIDLVSNKAVRLMVHLCSGFRIRCVDQAEDLPCLLIYPVPLGTSRRESEDGTDVLGSFGCSVVARVWLWSPCGGGYHHGPDQDRRYHGSHN